MEPLAGWTVAVTADRRAGEQAAMLERRGALVVRGPVVRTLALAPDDGLRAATAAVVDDPPDVLVAVTGIGVRSWFAASWSWGVGGALTEALDGATILARGPKAAGALMGEGLPVHWCCPDETLAGVLRHLLAQPVEGRCIAVQLAGGPQPWFGQALRKAGARVVELPVYQWSLPARTQPALRLVDAVVGGGVDALTFTSPPAVGKLFELARESADGLRACLSEGNVAVACVGPLTAAAARRAGAVDVVVADPARLGAMVRALSEHLGRRARHLWLAGVDVVVQGARLSVGGTEVALTRQERRLLETLLGSEGTVLSKGRLGRLGWGAGVDDHTVEVAVNRLRRKLGPAAGALETTNRRGYRLVVHSGLMPRPRLESGG